MPKSMIFLFDGTANDATDGLERFSNVYAINQLIADRKETPAGRIQTQITFYLPGVGTKFTVRKKGFFSTRPGRTRQYLFGDGIEQLILRAYVNLSANYHIGDEIILIGFSRGAVAARIFSRLISDFGILCSDMLLNLDKLWNDFVEISSVRDNTEYFRNIATLQSNFAEEAGKNAFHTVKGQPIRFLGVFDTVAGPLDNGVMKNIEFRDLHPAKGVKHVVHILSMHEIRAEFQLRRFEQSNNLTSSIREIWLPGVHSDVGGGYKENLVSNIALLTMGDLLKKLGGIAMDDAAYETILAEVRSKAEASRFVINAEPYTGLKRKRDGSIGEADEIHPLHWYLLNQQVFWKDMKQLTDYVNRIGKLGRRERGLARTFNKWLNLGNDRRRRV
jgi:uncharacterized protein (DUF2235 family)